jgi:hypothetical protein
MKILFKNFFKKNYSTKFKKQIMIKFNKSFRQLLDDNNNKILYKKINFNLKYYFFNKYRVSEYDHRFNRKNKLFENNEYFFNEKLYLNTYLNRLPYPFQVKFSVLRILTSDFNKKMIIEKAFFSIRYLRNFFLKYSVYFSLLRNVNAFKKL